MIKSIINQFRRMSNDDGRHDKVFAYQEHKLKLALATLKSATNELVRASTTLHDLLMTNAPSSIDDKKLH